MGIYQANRGTPRWRRSISGDVPVKQSATELWCFHSAIHLLPSPVVLQLPHTMKTQRRQSSRGRPLNLLSISHRTPPLALLSRSNFLRKDPAQRPDHIPTMDSHPSGGSNLSILLPCGEQPWGSKGRSRESERKTGSSSWGEVIDTDQTGWKSKSG